MPPTDRLLEAFAPAKINLWLHVTGQRADGYRELDSLVAFADVGDRLSIAPADGLSLTVSGPFAAALGTAAENLVLRAARALALHCGVPAEAALHLEKNLPVASGIGGGSADAAAALRLCARLWQVEIEEAALAGVALVLGADVPVCLAGETVRMTGIGEGVAPLVPPPPPIPAVLINPGVAVSTGQVFDALAGRFSLPAAVRDGDFAALALANRNDLEAPATEESKREFMATRPRLYMDSRLCRRSPGRWRCCAPRRRFGWRACRGAAPPASACSTATMRHRKRPKPSGQRTRHGGSPPAGSASRPERPEATGTGPGPKRRSWRRATGAGTGFRPPGRKSACPPRCRKRTPASAAGSARRPGE